MKSRPHVGIPHNRQIVATTKSARTPSKWLGNESVTRPGNHSNDKVEEKVGIETGGHPTQSAHHSNDKIGLRLRQNGSATSPSHGPEIIATTRSKKSRHPTIWLSNDSVTRPKRSPKNAKTMARRGLCACLPSPHEPTNLSASVRVSMGEGGTARPRQPLERRRRHTAVAAQVGGGTGGGRLADMAAAHACAKWQGSRA